ncbi:MAG TPA: hypothetical protein VLT61_05860 [Anaeromyxobacteraceae bacterium]|nr:hypothetical protein [Anaeromyxobacteraceae bacterium]
MADPHDNRILDKRVVHRYVRKGVVDEKEYEKHLKNLPDLADQAAPVEASIEGEDLDDEGDDTEGSA